MIFKYRIIQEDVHYQGRIYGQIIPKIIKNLLNTAIVFKLDQIKFLNVMMEPSSFTRVAVFSIDIDYDIIVEPNINMLAIRAAFIAQEYEMEIIERGY